MLCPTPPYPGGRGGVYSLCELATCISSVQDRSFAICSLGGRVRVRDGVKGHPRVRVGGRARARASGRGRARARATARARARASGRARARVRARARARARASGRVGQFLDQGDGLV